LQIVPEAFGKWVCSDLRSKSSVGASKRVAFCTAVFLRQDDDAGPGARHPHIGRQSAQVEACAMAVEYKPRGDKRLECQDETFFPSESATRDALNRKRLAHLLVISLTIGTLAGTPSVTTA
jgi:hypothetical protein